KVHSVAMCCETAYLFSGGAFPNPHGTIRGAGCDEFAVRRKRDAEGFSPMAEPHGAEALGRPLRQRITVKIGASLLDFRLLRPLANRLRLFRLVRPEHT